MELIRAILMEIEANDELTGRGPADLYLEGYTDAQIGYHTKLLFDAGYIDAIDMTAVGSPYPELKPTSLTWRGHEFLDAAKNETVWKRAMDAVREKGGSVPISVLQALLIEFAKQQFNLQ